MMIPLMIVLMGQFELAPVELYNLGNDYFEQGKYSEAIAAYEQASQKLPNARIYYNLGSAYFKKGMHGKAIVNFRRAQFISPRDRDIRANLTFVRNYRVDKISLEQSPIVKMLSSIFHFFSYLESELLTALVFLLAALLLAFFIIHRHNFIGYALIVVILFWVFFFLSWRVWAAERDNRNAVVVTPEVSAMSGPGEDYKEIVVIHDGAEVKVRERRGGYILIQLPGGIGGWIPVEGVEYVFGKGL